MSTPLHHAAAKAVAAHLGIDAASVKIDPSRKAELGDLSYGCFAVAKERGQNPAQLASEIAAAFQPSALIASAEAAGPYVNFRADRAATFRWVIGAALASGLVPAGVGAGKTICIDYSSPNISKHLAYHHIRSTMLGHALVQIFRALGYRVVGINHLGDWGTTHGMLIAAYLKWGADEPLDVTKLNDLYVRYRAAIEQNPALEGEARGWFKRLEEGDAQARKLWSRFRDISLAEYQTVYDALGVKFEEVRGESAYEADLPRVMRDLEGKKLVVTSEGARVVELEGEETPILLVTQDGTTLYATRDVAAAEYRWNTYHPARSLYVVDRGQSLHFRQLFKLLTRMGHEWAHVCEHVPFGLVQIGGKKTGTRSGNVVLLRDVLAEAEQRVQRKLAEENADVSPEVAAQVGRGAVVFANLAQQRDKDVSFEWDKVIALNGDSGPYLQYSHARCASILAKAGGGSTADADLSALTTEAEWSVARKLLEMGDVVRRAGERCEPHLVCHYLLDLAGEFSRWYTDGNNDATKRVLVDDARLRCARLALVEGVRAALRDGLTLLGLAAPDRM